MSVTRSWQNCRAVVCLAALVAASVAVTFLSLGGRVALQSKSKRQYWRNICFRSWANWVARLTAMRVHVKGTPPRPPFLLVSNHLSYLDIVALGSQVECVFVAKSEVERWPLFGWASRNIGTIFIARDAKRELHRALSEMERFWREGEGITFFPEGTTTPGHTVARFKPALLELAVREKLPVHYASICYQTRPGSPPASQSICWWGEMSFPRHLFELFRLGEFDAFVTFGDTPVQHANRKELAVILQKAVENCYFSEKKIDSKAA